LTLHPLLTKATANGILRLAFKTQQEGIDELCAFRNAILHGSFEQIAKRNGCADVPDYFKRQFASDFNALEHQVDHLFQ
jgi:hypothetical protein